MVQPFGADAMIQETKGSFINKLEILLELTKLPEARK